MDVLVDLTPLDTASRLRGIGHYVAYLGSALAALSPSEKQNLDIRGLTGLEGDVLGPLDWPGSEPLPYPADQSMRYIWHRRSKLVASLLRVRPRPRLLHVTQNLGTPRGSMIPRVITCHDMIRLVLHEQYIRSSRAYLEAYRFAELSRFALARRVIAVSQYTADDLMRVLAIPASRIDVVHHGVDMERFRPPATPEEEAQHQAQRRALGVDQRPYFLYVGATDPRKKADLLLSAFARARIPEAELIFAGWLTPEQKRDIEAVWASEGSPASVRFVGFVPDESMAALMHGSLGLIFPSIYEGFGMPVLEAMAAGCPVVTTAATCLGEVAGDAALLVKNSDLKSLQDALLRLASDSQLRAQLRDAGLARARQFTWRNTALGTVDSYVKALRLQEIWPAQAAPDTGPSVMSTGKFFGWIAALTLAGALAGPGCGTEPVAADGCRKIEEIRCELAPRCSNLKVPDVDACKRFYRDQCLHGLALESDPGAPVVDRCVEALKVAGACTATDNGCVATTTPVTSGCQILERPELAEDCKFLIPPASQSTGGVTLVAGNGGSGGSDGASGSSGSTSAGASGTGM